MLLRDYKNVLLTGPPGTGKSTLLAEVAHKFESPPLLTAGTITPPRGTYDPTAAPGSPAIPAVIAAPPKPPTWCPSPARKTRKVFSTVFDQVTTYRDFMRGLSAQVGIGATGVNLQVTKGTLYRANEHAKTASGTSLVIVDEINRGPAIKIFGSTISALEGDKRLSPEGNKIPGKTAEFEVLNDQGDQQAYSLAHDMYVLAAMNLADTSVEPLDAAFLRRFVPYRLEPDSVVLLEHFKLSGLPPGLPDTATTSAHMYAAVVRAWEAVNNRLALGRGEEFRIGQGVFMGSALTLPDGGTDFSEGAAYIQAGWARVMAHVDEVFFGNVAGIAATLNVGSVPNHPFSLERTTFAGQPVSRLVRVPLTDPQALYRLLSMVAINPS